MVAKNEDDGQDEVTQILIDADSFSGDAGQRLLVWLMEVQDEQQQALAWVAVLREWERLPAWRRLWVRPANNPPRLSVEWLAVNQVVLVALWLVVILTRWV